MAGAMRGSGPAVAKSAEEFVDITVERAVLLRIFDKLKGTQDCYVQLLRQSGEGNEKEIGRTLTHRGGDKAPYWGEKFKFYRGNAQKIIFRVVAEHFWRQDVVCGELAMDLDEYNLWNRILAGELLNTLSPVELVKRSKKSSGPPEKTGSLFICMAKCTQRSMDGRLDAFEKGGRSQDTKEGLQQLLNKPEELEIYVRHRFREAAKQTGRSGKAAVGPEAIQQLVGDMSQRLGVPKDTFGDIGQMFWRFEVSGEKLLYEEETVRLVMYMLRQYRDAVSPQKTGAVQLSGGIRYMKVDDKYNVSKELGRGGQGVVYLATDKENSNQEVVVKLYGKTNQKEAQESITQEFELLMELKHPKIARVFEIFQDWENVYIVQEPYFGGDLTTAVTKAHDAGVRVDERWLAGVSHQVLSGVEFLHNNGVVHSDLKEANVMVAGREAWHAPQVIVIDFGLANKFSAKSGVGGTPGYMPPEVWNHGLWTPRGDVFSVGAMIFTLRNGKHPFYPPGSPGLEEIAELTKTSQPDTMGSPPLQGLIRAMLEKNFLARPTSSQLLHQEWFASGATEDIDMHALSAIMQRQRKTELYRALLADIAKTQNLAQLRELNDLFMTLDVDNDGKITASEVRSALSGRWTPGDVDRLVACLMPPGANEAEELSYEDFMGSLMASQASDEERMLRKIFGEADTQGRGWIGDEEIAELAKRPHVKRMLGDRPASWMMEEMDLDRDGKVTFQEFCRVLQGEKPEHKARPSMKPGRYVMGQVVQYWSSSYSTWVTCSVLAVDPATGAVQVDQKPGYWLQGEELSRRLRAQQPKGRPVAYCQGQEVLMWSTSFHTWIPCKVVDVDPGTGAVQVDQKPGFWFRGHELETRLKHHGENCAPFPAAKAAGAGRALFSGAFNGFAGPPDQPAGAGGRENAGQRAGLTAGGYR